MEIEFLEKEKEKWEVKLIGETHTFCNILRKELWNDKDLKQAGYFIKHTLTDHPTLVVESKSPEKSIKSAIQSLKKQNKEFLTKFNKAL